MYRRKRSSGGQALVMATLGLLAMCGMLGLAVDLGWSFFVQKEAQAAADGAALAAVQEAVTRLGTATSTFTCSDPTLQGTNSNQIDCETTSIGCANVMASSNLNNGCLYAQRNGFGWSSPQGVSMQSNAV